MADIVILLILIAGMVSFLTVVVYSVDFLVKRYDKMEPWLPFSGSRGHKLVYYEMAAGYMAKCEKCSRQGSFMPGFSKWWQKKGERCKGGSS